MADGQVHAGQSQVPIRGPADRIAPFVHDYQTMGVGKAQVLVAEFGEYRPHFREYREVEGIHRQRQMGKGLNER